MKINFSPRYWVFFIALTVYATMTNAADGWRPSPAQAAAIEQACDGWKSISRGVFMMRTDGKSRPKGDNNLHEKIIE
ncbi:hypothetical protein [Simplicispira metamorpha]|uniref:hypothetical protein n=1 Tax=Simplicispira metamorpha TaxID=80881 RepID=UPI00104D3B62|nr:hypothetical protein [Simplicispira metamorpha]